MGIVILYIGVITGMILCLVPMVYGASKSEVEGIPESSKVFYS